MECHGERAGAARRRRERRLRSWWRHERMSIAMALATVEHHSYGPTANDALRGQKTVTRAGEVEERELHGAPRRQKPPPPGTRPTPLVEVGQWAMVQHSGIFELEQIPDVPVLQMVEQPVEVDTFFRLSLPAVAEQVIEVPKLALPGRAVPRAALSEPQLVEQLVDVPTVLSFSMLQAADSRAGCRHSSSSRSWSRCSWRSSRPLPGTGLISGFWCRYCRGVRFRVVEEVLGEVFQASPRDRALTAVCGADTVVSPAPHARGGVFSWWCSRPLPGTGLNSVWWCRQLSFLQLFTLVEVLVEVFQALPRDKVQQPFVEQTNVVSSASQGRGGGARGGRSGLSQVQGSSTVCEADYMSTFPFLMVVLKEVFNVFLVDRVPQRLPSSRIFLRLLILRCHEPRFMAVMTSGCAWLMRSNDTEYYWNRWDDTFLLAAAERSQAPLVPAPLWPLQGCGVGRGVLGSSPSLIGILAGMDQKDPYVVGFWCSSPWLFPSSTLCLVRSLGSVFTAPVAEPTVISFTVAFGCLHHYVVSLCR